MKSKQKRLRFSSLLWLLICVFILLIFTYPKWIIKFYPEPHRELIYTTARKYDVDPMLVFAIIRAESKYETWAESDVGAKGLMQIMPETAEWIAERKGISGFEPDHLHEPHLNVDFGCWYLSFLIKEFDNNLPLTIAAYNAGNNRVRGWVGQGLWDGDVKELDKIPYEETRHYVKNVLKNYEAYQAIYKNDPFNQVGQ
jgi:soluble lytic murein transglycosylase